MKRLVLILTIVLLVFYGAAQADGPFSAYVQVYDENGDPLAGVNFRLDVETFMECPCPFGEGEEPPPGGSQSYYGSDTGTSDSNGYLFLSVSALPGDLVLMRVYRLSVQYSTISSENTSTTTATTLYPVFHLGPPIVDNDGDSVDDGLELQLAEKFKPVLHKHSWEKQQGLSNMDWLLTGKATLKAYNIAGSEVYNSTIADPSQIHVYQGSADRDSFGSGDLWTFWKFNIHDAYRYQGAPIGQRPVYYHVYKEDDYYYVQYWFFFNMNDLQDQTVNGTWHEGDFEHVSIKVNSALDPVAVNFYRHEGGRTFSPSECWWSSSDNPTYSGIAQGYTSSRTHLHIWIAANAHATYNRYSRVWRVSAAAAMVDFCLSLDDEYYTDNVDFDPSGYDLY
ncbi:hypothetical protein MJD09_06485, partial [bacterium]|nr:hypothetical protein [bacterium]